MSNGQLAFAGQLATTASVRCYHGGCERQTLVEYPGFDTLDTREMQ